MQLFSPFRGSYRCGDIARGNPNHGPGSFPYSRVATIRGTPKIAISCQLSVKEVGRSSFILHPSSFILSACGGYAGCAASTTIDAKSTSFRSTRHFSRDSPS